MDKQKADEILTEYLPKIYGFAIKKAFSYAEAEDICADIVEELYSLLNALRVLRLATNFFRGRVGSKASAKIVNNIFFIALLQ